MQIIDAEQRSPEWFAARLGIATASGFSNILAKGRSGEAATRRNYRVKLALQRITGQIEEGFTTPAMQTGIEREPIARAEYEALTGNLVDEVGFCRHDTLEAGASPDGLVDEDGGIEIKCPSDAVFLEYLRAPAEPPEYTAQIQGCMWITGRAWWDFVSYNPNFPENARFIVRRIARDDAYIDKLAAEVARFMEEVRAEETFIRNWKAAA